ncbi:MAG: hypothetical protein CL424_14355, partial [Acidimicrobiaceae bacterium]|nr:hypothetical protein [Acidimicrobiaceae bacterium]
MTGHDQRDALIDALRQPALPAEHAGERASIEAMSAALGGGVTPRRRRTRKGVAVIAVTAASLGVGGLAAAGPGVFPAVFDLGRSSAPTEQIVPTTSTVDELLERQQSAEADESRPTATMLDDVDEVDDVGTGDVRAAVDGVTGGEGGSDGERPECADGVHGDAVAEATRDDERDPGEVADTARDNCGNLDDDGSGNPDPAQPVVPGNEGNGNGQPADPGNGNGNGQPADPGNGNGNGQP